MFEIYNNIDDRQDVVLNMQIINYGNLSNDKDSKINNSNSSSEFNKLKNGNASKKNKSVKINSTNNDNSISIEDQDKMYKTYEYTCKSLDK